MTMQSIQKQLESVGQRFQAFSVHCIRSPGIVKGSPEAKDMDKVAAIIHGVRGGASRPSRLQTADAILAKWGF